VKKIILFTLGLIVAMSIFNIQISTSTPTSSQQTPEQPKQKDEW